MYTLPALVCSSCGQAIMRPYASKEFRATTSAEYKAWKAMRARCLSVRRWDYPLYGGRGITFDPEWNDFAKFYEYMGPKPSKAHSLERLDRDAHYEPGNVVWADHKQQNRNTRRNRMLTMQGETRCLAEWAEIKGINSDVVHSRLRRGWSVENALTIQPRHKAKHEY